MITMNEETENLQKNLKQNITNLISGNDLAIVEVKYTDLPDGHKQMLVTYVQGEVKIL